MHTDAFIRERRYLKNVSTKTLLWYRDSFKAFEPVLGQSYDSSGFLKGAIISQIGVLRERNKAVSVNTYLRCIKAFLNWAHEEGHLKEKVKLASLKEEKTVLQTFTPQQVRALVHHKPSKATELRIQSFVLTLLDTGLRLSEALGLTREAVDIENMVLKVKGKGNKERLVPFSVELRRILWKYLSKTETKYVFANRYGGTLRPRDILRDFKRLGKRRSS
jgi:integrase/recombinase XerD